MRTHGCRDRSAYRTGRARAAVLRRHGAAPDRARHGHVRGAAQGSSAGEYPEYPRVPGGPDSTRSTGEYPESTMSSVVAAERDDPSADDAAWASGDGKGECALVGVA